MLDDLKYIHDRDQQDALGIAEKQWEQVSYPFHLDRRPQKFDNIVFAGMGGSALAALISTVWPGFDVPFEICRKYEIPRYVSDKTLFFASSYSGNTEETLSALAKAEKKGARIVVMTSGGRLRQIADNKGYLQVRLPDGLQPRYASLYSLKGLVGVLDVYGFTSGNAKELEQASDFLKNAVTGWRPDVATKNNKAKQIALELMGKSVVIYGGPLMYPVAYKWKIGINENAKQVAWCNQLPEFNHNEMLGWTEQPKQKPYAVIELRSSLEHERVQKRFATTEKLLSGRRPAPIVIEPEGKTLLEQLLWTIVLGDFTSLYLSIVNGLNPTPVELIEKFKKELG